MCTCGGAAHDVNGVTDQQPHARPCDTRDVVVPCTCTRATHAACARRHCMWGAACFWLSRQCFCSRGVFAAAANVFALCLLGERMFLLVFGPKFNEEVWSDGPSRSCWKVVHLMILRAGCFPDAPPSGDVFPVPAAQSRSSRRAVFSLIDQLPPSNPNFKTF